MNDEFEPHDVSGQPGDVPSSDAPDDAEHLASTEPASTGNAVVDDVLTGLVGLDERPVDEHVAVFEHAHEQLRGVLDGPRMPRP